MVYPHSMHWNSSLLKGCITIMCCDSNLKLYPIFVLVCYEYKVSEYFCSVIGIILFPYGYSQKSSAHYQHCQTPKACDIDDIFINGMYMYLYVLRQ